MSEMITRAAAAIMPLRGCVGTVPCSTECQCKQYAEAVLKAIREPTENMIYAAGEVPLLSMNWMSAAPRWWMAMADEALVDRPADDEEDEDER